MNEHVVKTEKDSQVGMQRIFMALWRRIWLVFLVAILIAGLTLAMVSFFVTPTYQSSTMFYVNNNDLSVGGSLDISSADLTAAKDLVASYIVILNTRKTLQSVKEYAGVDLSIGELRDMISAEAVNSTEIFRVVVTSSDWEQALKITQAIEHVLPQHIDSVIEGTSSRVVDSPILAREDDPNFPDYTQSTILGFLLGFLAMSLVVVLQELFDITIRSEENVVQVCKHPILAAVPDMGAPSKGGYYYGYGNKEKSGKKPENKKSGSRKTVGPAQGANPKVMGGQISFAAAEAYKLLRTKLQFSFTDGSASRVIGFSSALSGEGKSLTAINLAYTLSQLNKKVLLIDCDMRRPTLAEKLVIRKLPGLSGYLTGQHGRQGLIRPCNLKNDENAFQVITAGQNPPNPIELLSSEKMTEFLQQLRLEFDYVILDLPPVGEVSDAMSVAKETDGMLLVVRQNYCDRVVLKDAVRQFEFIDAKILGVVYNCASENSGRYGKNYYRKYYRRYYRRDYARAGYGYENAYMARRAAELGASEGKPAENVVENKKYEQDH